MEYGIVVYDVPKARKAVYNRLRDKLRRVSIQMTWSVYMTPYGIRDQLLAILKELDDDENHNERIRYRYIKFDPSEKAVLDQIVKDDFARMIQSAKDELQQKLGETEQQFSEDELNDKALVQRAHLSKALKKVNEARRLATLFEVTDIMEAQFQAMADLVEARRERIKDELEKAKAQPVAAK
jgi:hypothetical protein